MRPRNFVGTIAPNYNSQTSNDSGLYHKKRVLSPRNRDNVRSRGKRVMSTVKHQNNPVRIKVQSDSLLFHVPQADVA